MRRTVEPRADGDSQASSLARAGAAAAALPFLLGAVTASAMVAGVDPSLVAWSGAAMLGLSAVTVPLVLQRLVGTRLRRLADVLRAARDGRFDDAVADVRDGDAIGDIARLVGDLVSVQADVGRYATNLRRADTLEQMTDAVLGRIETGAVQIESAFRAAGERIAETIAGLDGAAGDTRRVVSQVDGMLDRLGLLKASLDADGALTDKAADLMQDAARAVEMSVRRLVEDSASSSRHLASVADRLERIEVSAALTRQAVDSGLDEAVRRLETSLAAAMETPVDLEAFTASVAALHPMLDDIGTAVGSLLAESRAPRETTADAARVEALLSDLSDRLSIPADRAMDQVTPAGVDLSSLEAAVARIADDVADLRDRKAANGADPELDIARGAVNRLLVAFRLALREIAAETERYRAVVGAVGTTIEASPDASPANDAHAAAMATMAGSLAEFSDRFVRLEAAITEARDTATSTSDLGLHPEIDLGQSSLQRLLVALRLVIRDIAAETNRMRDAADGAAEGSDALRRVAVTASDRIDAAVEILAARRDGLPAVTGSTSDPQVAPPLRLERDGLAAALTAFRMLMREIKGDADALRSCLQQLSTVGATPAPFDLAPLVADLRDRLEAGNAVLADVHAQVSRQGAHAARDPDVSAAPLLPSLGQTIGLMSAFTAAMENRFTDLEARIAEVAVRCSSGDARENLSDLVQALYAAGGDLRRDMSEFLAVGAALTKEVESVAPRGGLVRPVPNRRSARPA